MLYTFGGSNSAFGANTLLFNTSGTSNSAFGVNALQKNTTGCRNTGIGIGALSCNTTGKYNTAVGDASSLKTTTGQGNTSIGLNALVCNTTGNRNTALGYQALYNTTGALNIGIGANSGTCITSGACNVILGSASANGFGTQSCNIFISDGAGNIRMFVTGSTGFTGINTTSPSYTLDVAGDTRVTGNTITYVQFNNQVVNTYTLGAADDSKLVEMDVSIANTVTVPTNASVGFPVGTEITIIQQGTGQTTIAAAGGVTLRSAGGLLNLASQYSAATLIKRGTDEWYVVGDLS
jgi:hypothetical protein